MQFKVFATLSALLACSTAALLAQDVPSRQPMPAPIGVINDVDVLVTNVTLEKLDNPPKREIRFVRVMVPVKQKLVRVDPKLIEQKYAAIVQLELPQEFEGARYLREPDVEYSLQFWSDSYLLNPRRHGDSPRNTPQSDVLKRMLKFIPEGRQPAADELEFFTSTVDEGLLIPINQQFLGILGPYQRGFHILAVTPDQAERRAEAFLTILDQGFSRPMQMALFKKRGPRTSELVANRKLLTATLAEVDRIKRELESYTDFTPEMLPGLRVQQLQLDVDLAGVTARIKTCDRLLAQGGKPERQQQLEDAKIAAEIELSGFEARRAKSEEFVGKVKKKIELSVKHIDVQNERAKLAERIGINERNIHILDEVIQQHSPLPLVDGKVIIAPLEWTQ